MVTLASLGPRTGTTGRVDLAHDLCTRIDGQVHLRHLDQGLVVFREQEIERLGFVVCSELHGYGVVAGELARLTVANLDGNLCRDVEGRANLLLDASVYIRRSGVLG
jgi:hypothetical protein